MSNRDFFTRPDPFTPRSLHRPADYGSAITRYEKQGKNRPLLNYALAVAIGVGLALLLTWRG